MVITVFDSSVMAVAPAPVPSSDASIAPVSLAAAAGGGNLLFRQFFDADTGTFTYLLVDVPSRQGVLIDSVSWGWSWWPRSTPTPTPTT